MANRNFASGGKLWSMHAYPVHVSCTFQIGAAGAVGAMVGAMVQSVTRSSQGIYSIQLQPQAVFPKLLCANGSAQSASGALSGISAIEIGNAPNAQSVNGIIIIKTLNEAGALADPANGSAINLSAIFSNSSVVIGGE